MTFLDLPDWLGKPLAVLLIDLSLAGDNALAIALVCLQLPPPSRRTVLLIGTLGAIVLRVLLAGLAGAVIAVPGLKLLGGLLLLLVALNLARRDLQRPVLPSVLDARSGVWAAALVVMLIDVLMSLDNVFALAAVAAGSVAYLAAGLVLSVTILMFGSTLLAHLLGRLPNLARLGAALLGWVAGQMAITDPLVAEAIATQAPALPLLVPALAAAYVYLLGRTMRPAPAALPVRPPPPPARRPAAVAPPATPEPDGIDSERVVLLLFVGLFLVVGLGLGILSIYAGGLIR